MNDITLQPNRFVAFHAKVEARLRDPSIWKITTVALRIILFLSRCLNFLFGDHRWGDVQPVPLRIDRSEEPGPSALPPPALPPELIEAQDELATFHELRLIAFNEQPRTYFQTLANEFGLNSKFEGATQKATVGLLSKFCSEIAPEELQSRYGIDLPMLDEMRNTIFLESTPLEEIGSALAAALSEGRPALIAGGWTGAPHGHAMMYEVVPVDDQTVHFRIFNLGAGALYHQIHIVDGKAKAAPGVEWRSIRKDDLLSPAVLKAMIEMKIERHVPEEKVDTAFNEKDIYQGLFDQLSPTSCGVIHGNVPFKTLQHSGICTWRSIEAFLSTRLDEAQYKKLILDIKLSSLHALSDLLGRTPADETAPKVLTLVNKGRLKLARKVDNAFSKGYVPEAYVTEAHQLLKHAVRAVKYRSDLVTYEHPEKESAAGKFAADVKYRHNPEYPPLEQLFAGGASEAGVFTYNITYQLFNLLLVTDPATALSNLAKAAWHAERIWLTGSGYDALNVALTDYICKLPFDPQFWSQLPSAETSIHLRVIGEVTFKTSFMIDNASLVHPESVFCHYKLKNIFLLLGIGENAAFKAVGLNKWDRLNRPNEFCRVFGKEYANEYVSLLSVWTPLYDLFDVDLDNNDLSLEIKPNETLNKNILFECLMEVAPQVHHEIEQKLNLTINYSEMTNTRKNRALLACDVLPEWMLGCRDNALAEAWLIKRPVGRLSNLNPAQDLRFQFINESGADGKLLITLSGVTAQIYIDNPQLKKISEGVFKQTSDANFDYKFEGWFRKISNPTLRLLINEFAYKIIVEKGALSTIIPGQISDGEFYELAMLFTTDEHRPYKLFAYFTKYPSKLNDPDFQVLFKFLLYERNVSESIKLGRNPQFLKAASKFIQERFHASFQEGQIGACVFLNQIAGALETYFPDEPAFYTTFERFAALLNKPVLTFEETIHIHMGLIEYVYRQDNPSDDELVNALRSLVGVSAVGEHIENIDPEMVRCRNRFGEKFASRIQKFFNIPKEVDQARVNAVLKDKVQAGEVWSCRQKRGGYEFVNANDTISYDPFTGDLIGVSHQCPIPQKFLKSALFSKFFPNTYFCDGFKNDVCKIVTPSRDEYYVMIDEIGCLTIDRRNAVDGTWSRLMNYTRYMLIIIQRDSNRTKLECLFHSNYIAMKYEGWVERGAPHQVRFYHRNVMTPTPYVLDMNLMELSDVQRNVVLRKPTDRISRFELPEFIHEWYSTSDSPVYLELSRYKLEFEQNNGRYASKQIPSYYLLEGGRIPCLGRFKEYLVLENDSGHKKIILPRLQPKAVSQHRLETLLPFYELDFDNNNSLGNGLRYFVYNIGSDGVPQGDSLESNLWLAMVFALAHKYDRSAAILRIMADKVVPYSEREQRALENIRDIKLFNGDDSGEANAIGMYARFLLARNKSIAAELETQEIDRLLEAYYGYLQHVKNATALRLTPFEERYLCKWLLGCAGVLGVDRLIPVQNRYDTLTTQCERSANFVAIPATESKKETKSSTPQIWKSDDELYASARKPYLLTRAGYHIRKHFGYFHALAAGQPCPEKEQLAAACRFLKNQDNYRQLGEYLLLVMEHPDTYESPTSVHLESWQQVQKRAQQLLEQHPLQEVRGACITQQQPKIERPLPQSGALEPIPFTFATKETPAVDFEGYFNEVQDEQEDDTGAFKEWLLQVRAGRQEMTPLEQREYKRLLTDCDGVQKERAYDISEDQLTTLETALTEGRDVNKDKLDQLRRSIVKRTHSSAIRQKLKKLGGEKRITFDEILISFARKKPELLAQKNPELTQETLHGLYSDLAEYLQLATWEQQRERALVELRKVKKATGEKRKGLIQSLRKASCARRAYAIESNPALLVFEYYSEKLLWDKQVKGLNLFLERKGENPVMELIMGSGKSEVLLPLLALLRADGECISMLIAPQTLFENVSSNTQKIIKEAFGQTLKTIHFDRNTKLTPTKLELILEDLKDVRDNREAVVLTSKTIQCLILKFIEEAHRHYRINEAKGVPPQTLRLLGEILELLSTSGLPIVDEADSILKIMHVVSFNIGSMVAPHDHEIAFIHDIYAFVLNLPEEILTQDAYDNKLKMVFARELIRWFKTATPGRYGLEEREAACLAQLPENLLMDYFYRNVDRKNELDAWFRSIPEKKVRDLVALAAEEVSHLLSFTLLKEWNVAYGLDHKQRTAIPVPFEFAAVPKRGSVFANPYITKNYAFQSYYKEGVKQEQINDQVKRLQDQANVEMRKLGLTDCTQTVAWKTFCLLKGDLDIPLLGFKPEHLKLVTDYVNSSKENLLKYTAHLVLPQLSLFSHKLTCSPINMISLFRWASGCTGTLWNDKSMYHLLTPFAENGTEAMTLKILWKNCSGPDAVIIVKNRSSHQLLEEMHKIPHDVVIDGGGYLKELSNKEVAKKMTELSGKPTVHYNEKGEKVVNSEAGEVPLRNAKLKMKQRQTYYDHSHTVGANVLQDLTAIGLVTIGKSILLRDLLQFVWRMRGLAALQRVKFVVSEEVATIICDALELPNDTQIRFVHILAFAIQNQAKQQGNDNHKSFDVQLWNIPQQLLLRTLFNKTLTEEQKGTAYNYLESVWIQAVASGASECFGATPIEIDAHEDVKQKIQKMRGSMRECYRVCPFLNVIREESECYAEIEKIRLQIADTEASSAPSCSSSTAPEVAAEAQNYYLPLKVSSPEQPGDETVDIEVDVEVDTEKDLEVIQDNRKNGINKLMSHEPITKFHQFGYAEIRESTLSELRTRVMISLDDVLAETPELRSFAGLFDGVNLSINMFQWDQALGFKESVQLFGSQRVPLKRVVMEVPMIVLSEDDYIITQCNENVYDIDYGFCHVDNDRPLSEDEKFRLVKIKFFYGETSYTREERQLLKRWIGECGAVRLKEFFERHALAGYPSKAERYRGSWLQKHLRSV